MIVISSNPITALIVSLRYLDWLLKYATFILNQNDIVIW